MAVTPELIALDALGQGRPCHARLRYSDGIAGSRTTIALEADAAALQRRLGDEWELAPYTTDDPRATWLKGANMYVPFHEVYAFRKDGRADGLPQRSWVAFVSQARERATGKLAHLHWFAYTEDPADVPGTYDDSTLADVTRSQTFSKTRRGETQVTETFSAVAGRGAVHLSLTYDQGGDLLMWASPDKPNLPLRAANNPRVVRWYQEDQVMNVVHSDPLGVNRVSELSLNVKGELGDVFDGNERIVAVAIQRPYMRQVYVP